MRLTTVLDMPVPTGVAARELQNSVTTNSDHQWPTENGDEYYASYSSSMEQDIGLCTSFSEVTNAFYCFT